MEVVRRIERSLKLLGLLFLGAFLLSACDLGKEKGNKKRDRSSSAEPPPVLVLSYVGRDACRSCHTTVDTAYSGSQHEYATQLPSAQTVKAPMEGEAVSGKFVAARFEKSGEKFLVKSSAEYAVKWTLGSSPVQQLVVETEGGRVQAFPAVFDTRKAWEGGQKWFLLDGSDVAPQASNHFLKSEGNWNAGCAPCHSTHVEKNFEPKSGTYKTTFSELNVSCEACHGAGSRHVEIAKGLGPDDVWPSESKDFGFPLALAKRADRRWFRRKEEDTAVLTSVTDGPPETTQELASCGPCHSTHSDLGPAKQPRPVSDPFFDRYLLPYLTQENTGGTQAADPYSLGPFLMSRKAQANVVCSDCHDPHSTLLRKPVEELCVSCHKPEKYESFSHHFHRENAETPVLCVDCHMPKHTFLGVDARRDHSFTIPRPDLSETTGEPTACTPCHQAKSPAWASAAIKKAHGEPKEAPFGLAFHAVEHRVAGAAVLLTDVYDRTDLSPRVRASALLRWADLDEHFLSTAFEKAVEGASRAEHPLLRRAAALAGHRLSQKLSEPLLQHLLSDEMRAVRITAALELSTPQPSEKTLRALLFKVLEEAEESATYRADSLDGLLLLGDVERARGNVDKARAAYESAAQFASQRPEPVLRIHTLLRHNRKDEAPAFAASSLKAFPQIAELHYSVAMALIEKDETRRVGVSHLRTAFEIAPPRFRRAYGYDYAMTMHKLGDWAEALALLRLLDREIPGDPKVNAAMELVESRR